MSGPDVAGVALTAIHICGKLATGLYTLIRDARGATDEARKSKVVNLLACDHGLMAISQTKPNMPLFLCTHALRKSGSYSKQLQLKMRRKSPFATLSKKSSRTSKGNSMIWKVNFGLKVFCLRKPTSVKPGINWQLDWTKEILRKYRHESLCGRATYKHILI